LEFCGCYAALVQNSKILTETGKKI